MPQTKRRKANAAPDVVIEPAISPDTWTQVAFVITLAVAIARAMMAESVRDALEVVPNASAPPRGVGPAVTLLLDALCCVPALLVLLRRALDPAYALRWTWSHVLFAALALWSACSVVWASDRFLGLINAANMLAAAALVWSTAQLVRSWLRLRIVAGVALGLLMVYTAAGLQYRLMDVPENVRFWNENKGRILQERGWEPDSYAARAFERKLVNGEMVGFNTSPNSLAAIMVMLLVIAAGVAIQRRASGDAVGWTIAVAAAALPALIVVRFTNSRTAIGTLAIGGAALAGLAVPRVRQLLATRARLAYFAAAGAILLGTAALVAHGAYHGSLPNDSLNFRWRYWAAAGQIVRQHPLLGVGWGNFGGHYLAVRAPAAAEEVRDPHNFVVRGFAELGLVGGALVIAWLARAAWELTRPVTPPDARTSGQRGAVRAAAAAVLLGVALNIFASIDFAQQSSYVVLEVFRRVTGLGLIFVGVVLACARRSEDVSLDDRPAQWVLWAVVVGLGLFLIHNMMDFVMAEPGALTLFAVMLGAALGARMPAPDLAPVAKPATVDAPETLLPRSARQAHGRGFYIGWLSAATLAWVAAIVAVVIPVADAEQRAHDADEHLRAGRADVAAGQLLAAFQTVNFNADYAYRSSRALLIARGNPDEVRARLATAIAADATNVGFNLTLARLELSVPGQLDEAAVRQAFERALALDPQNVSARLEYARALEDRLARPRDAARQYRLALATNAAYHPDEPERLPPPQVSEIEQRIARLEAGTTQPS